MRTKTLRSWDEHLESNLREALTARKEALTGGSASDFAEYRELVGTIRGIQFAIDELIQVRDKFDPDKGE